MAYRLANLNKKNAHNLQLLNKIPEKISIINCMLDCPSEVVEDFL